MKELRKSYYNCTELLRGYEQPLKKFRFDIITQKKNAIVVKQFECFDPYYYYLIIVVILIVLIDTMISSQLEWD